MEKLTTQVQITNFLAKIYMTDGCWEWTAGKGRGYGRFGVNGISKLAHRVSYTFFVGDIPEGLVIDHLCRNKGCVRPDHLEPVEFVENVRRGTAWNPDNMYKSQLAGAAAQRAKTHCPKGHEYKGANLYLYKSFRSCRICRKAACDRSYQLKKEKAS